MTKQEFQSFIDAVVVLRSAAPDEVAVNAVAAYPKHKEGTIYEAGERIVYEGQLYSVIKKTTAKTSAPDKSTTYYSLLSPQ